MDNGFEPTIILVQDDIRHCPSTLVVRKRAGMAKRLHPESVGILSTIVSSLKGLKRLGTNLIFQDVFL